VKFEGAYRASGGIRACQLEFFIKICKDRISSTIPFFIIKIHRFSFWQNEGDERVFGDSSHKDEE
jgi:hypothetical protein